MATDTLDPIMFPALRDAQGTLDMKRKSLADIFTEAGPEYDMTKVKSVPGDSHDIVKFIGQLNSEINEAKGKVDGLLVVAHAARAAANHPNSDSSKTSDQGRTEPGTGLDGARKGDLEPVTFSKQLIDSRVVKEYTKGSSQGPQATIDVELKTLFQESTGIGYAPQSIRTGVVIPFATFPAPKVIDYIPQTTTQFPAVVYMEETTYTNPAVEVLEGGLYPEAALGLTQRSVPVQKISVFLPVTDEQFEDLPRAQAYVENRLPFMLSQRLDAQVILGNGTAPNLLGMTNVAGINVQPLGADPVPDALYKAMVAIRQIGFAEPSVVFMRPDVWQGVQLLRTSQGQYIWGHPSVMGPMTIWGVPVVQTMAMGATRQAVLGDFTHFSELAIRRGIDMQISNSHNDFFIRGQLALRADVRVAAVWYRASAFALVTGL